MLCSAWNDFEVATEGLITVQLRLDGGACCMPLSSSIGSTVATPAVNAMID